METFLKKSYSYCNRKGSLLWWGPRLSFVRSEFPSFTSRPRGGTGRRLSCGSDGRGLYEGVRVRTKKEGPPERNTFSLGLSSPSLTLTFYFDTKGQSKRSKLNLRRDGRKVTGTESRSVSSTPRPFSQGRSFVGRGTRGSLPSMT